MNEDSHTQSNIAGTIIRFLYFLTEIDLNRQYIAMPTAKIIWLLLITHEKNMAIRESTA